MENQTNKVSVITPVYNSARYITNSIRSVQTQSYTNWEMLLVDDCSTDNSVELIKAFELADDRIKLIRLEKNSGPAVARNKAIEAATGRYIAFLDSDDVWLPEKLERQVSFMSSHQYVLTHHYYHTISPIGNLSQKVIKCPLEINYAALLNYNYIGCLTAMYDAEQLGKQYMPNILKRQDYALWLKILKQGHKAYAINLPLAAYRILPKSISSNKWNTVGYNWMMLRQIEKLSFFKSLYHFTAYAIIGIKKYYIR